MEVTELTVRVLLLFFPGVVCAMLADALTFHRERKLWSFVLNSFVLGLGCYILYFLVLQVVGHIMGWIGVCIPRKVRFLEALLAGKGELATGEIVIVTSVAVPLALVLTLFSHHRLVHRLARKAGITKKFGDLDVWDRVFNSSDIPEWVVVRDGQRNLAYEGWVRFFSDTADANELFLRDVRVVDNDTGKEIYSIWGLYLTRPRDSLTIEFTGLEATPRSQEHHEPESNREDNGGQNSDSKRRGKPEPFNPQACQASGGAETAAEDQQVVGQK